MHPFRTWVKRLQIAKGSVYQYFENKRDLYFYLQEVAEQKFEEEAKDVLLDKDSAFSKWFRKYLQAYLTFQLKFPLYASFLQNVAQEQYSEELGNLMRIEQVKHSNALAKAMKKRGTVTGKKKTDYALPAFLMHTLRGNLLNFLLAQKGIDLHSYVAENKPIKKITKEEIKATVKTTLALINLPD